MTSVAPAGHGPTDPDNSEDPEGGPGTVDDLFATMAGAELPADDPGTADDIDLAGRPVGPDDLPPAWRAPDQGRIAVLRIGHRPQRDKRITTHVCLSARALGADAVYLHEPDLRIERGVEAVVARFGGPFHVQAVDSWRRVLRSWKDAGATVAHLTMYGLPLDEAVARLRHDVDATPQGAQGSPPRDLLVVIGAEKVPPDVYEAADVNVAVGNQPHSEVAALALFLDRITQGTWPARPFHGAVHIEPEARGKRVSPTDPR